MNKPLCLAACSLALLIAQATAQLPRDSWVVSALTANGMPGGLWVVAPGQTAVTQPQPQSVAMAWANAVICNVSGSTWYATAGNATTFPNEIFSVITTPSQVILEQRLTNGPVGALGGGTGISGLTRVHNQLWFATSDGLVGWVNEVQPSQTPHIVLTVPLTSSQYLNSITTDGREIYLGRLDAFALSDVLAFDPAATTPVLRSVAMLPGTPLSFMSLGPGGALLTATFPGVMRAVDTISGTATNVSTTTLYNINGAACNPWLRLCCVGPVAGVAPRPVDFLDLATGTWLPNTLTIGPGCAITGVAAVCEDPFLLFGSGCPGTGNVEPRLRWTGLPMLGNTAAITVQPVTASTLALFIFGLSRTSSPLGNLPLDGGSFGAPGCRLLVSPDIVLAQLATGSVLSQPLAVSASPSLTGLVAYSQWAVFAPVNPLGLVTSEAVEITVR